MPSHPDRVRRNNCKGHRWIVVHGVNRIDAHHIVLDGYWCINCDTIISKQEYDKLYKEEDDRTKAHVQI